MLLLLAVITATACVRVPKVEPTPRGIVRFTGEPKYAGIEIDEKRLGPLHMFETDGVLLIPGQHRIIARADGHFPEYRLIEVTANEVIVVEFNLRPIPE
ncbi:MAG: hypothetical protein QNJ97_19760 [Myxococcota bacterium]|nr:hypothetical protein [Myxococcota bacterium]